MSEKAITWRKLDELTLWGDNPNQGDLSAIVPSINRFGYNESIIVWQGRVQGGNHRVMALRQLWQGGWRPSEKDRAVRLNGDGLEVATWDVSHLESEQEANAFGIALNRTTRLGMDDPAKLAALLQDIKAVDESAFVASGFDGDDLDNLLKDLGQFEDPPEDPGAQVNKADELREKWQTERGQLWVIPSATGQGEHRILCGDSTDADDVARLMGGVKVQGAFTSPPYAMQRKDQYGGIPADEYVEWWDGVQKNVKDNLLDDGSVFVNIKPHCEDGERVLYVMDLVLAMKRRWGWVFIDEFCWTRIGVPKMVKYRFKNAFEPIYQFAINQGFKFRPTAVQHDSYNVPIPGGEGVGDTNWARWQGQASSALGTTGNLFGGDYQKEGKAYPSNLIKPFSNDSSRGHPAAFATQLVEFFIKAYSDNLDCWYDPFLGSGTTIVACEQTGRIGYGMEIAPEYVAVSLERLAGLGLEPRLHND